VDLGVGPEFPIFVPATTYAKDGRAITVHLMEGYVFVSSGLPETSYFALEQKFYVNQVMSSKVGPYGMRTLSTISDTHIKDLRRQLRDAVSSDISLFDQVRVLDGVFKSLEGKVLGVHGEEAHVQIELRSMNVIATIPLVFLEAFEEVS
jgi:transcription antitermination factor NusG